MLIGIASDHRGHHLKQKLLKYLTKVGYDTKDFGSDGRQMIDYPDVAFELGKSIVDKDIDLGIAICGSGIGISIACNKVKGIRCAKVDSIKEAKFAKLDNDANVLALNGSMPTYKAKDIVDTFLKTKYSALDRHQRRIDKISEYEKAKRKNRKKIETEDNDNEC